MTAKRPRPAAEAFRHLQAGNAERALESARDARTVSPTDARAHLAEGIALRMLQRFDAAFSALERSARLDPGEAATAYEMGVVHQLQGDLTRALERFEQARMLKPSFFAAHFSAGSLCFDRGDWSAAAERFRTALALQPGQVDALRTLARALQRAGRASEAEQAFVHALAADPHDVDVLRAFGQYSVGRGNFKRAATLYAEALRSLPQDEALPMYVAQVELLLGRWQPAWAAYARRATRRHMERTLAAQGAAYRIPALQDLAGRDVQLIAEQGLGDILFFLRWAQLVKAAGARLRFVGPAALHSLLARTGLFESLHAFSARDVPAAVPVLVGDLPAVAHEVDPFTVPSLRITPLGERVTAWRARFEMAGPHPWVALTWRAGQAQGNVDFGLFKTAPIDRLGAAVAAMGGTPVVLQRRPEPAEMQALRQALGRDPVDLSTANDDLEDALAVTTLVDRYLGVSNTNMHLAAAAGSTADVMVPFPPEWRWRAEGVSPWFPGFRVHRQDVDGDWSRAFAELSS